jgi:hypothetical protein
MGIQGARKIGATQRNIGLLADIMRMEGQQPGLLNPQNPLQGLLY